MGRPPATIQESITANCRPQPAIPALLVLMLTLMYAFSLAGTAEGATWSTWVVVTGVLVSCGLAVAAGFCSVFPPLAWIAVAWLGFGVLARVPGAGYVQAAVMAGVAAAVAMVLAQIWRVRTGKFVPTIDDRDERAGEG